MFKWIKECYKDWCEVQKELNDMGLWTAYHQWGAYVHYVEPKFSTYINNTDDKQDTIPKNNR